MWSKRKTIVDAVVVLFQEMLRMDEGFEVQVGSVLNLWIPSGMEEKEVSSSLFHRRRFWMWKNVMRTISNYWRDMKLSWRRRGPRLPDWGKNSKWESQSTGPGMLVRNTWHGWHILFQICLNVPQADINFNHRHEQQGGHLIRGAFNITQKPSILLKAGEALITFEEERGNTDRPFVKWYDLVLNQLYDIKYFSIHASFISKLLNLQGVQMFIDWCDCNRWMSFLIIFPSFSCFSDPKYSQLLCVLWLWPFHCQTLKNEYTFFYVWGKHTHTHRQTHKHTHLKTGTIKYCW